jgi:hypothetical protein
MTLKAFVGAFAVTTAIMLLDAAPAVARQPEPRLRETMTVWFTKPVLVGDRVLLGKYVIEHSNSRVARGRPCTYIYAASDMRLPVVAFHCTHLNRPMRMQSTVIVRPLGEPNGMARLMEFQFAGERGAHGAPVSR